MKSGSIFEGGLVFDEVCEEKLFGDKVWSLSEKDVSSERDSSELKGDESLLAFYMGFGTSKLIESEKRMKLRS